MKQVESGYSQAEGLINATCLIRKNHDKNKFENMAHQWNLKCERDFRWKRERVLFMSIFRTRQSRNSPTQRTEKVCNLKCISEISGDWKYIFEHTIRQGNKTARAETNKSTDIVRNLTCWGEYICVTKVFWVYSPQRN